MILFIDIPPGYQLNPTRDGCERPSSMSVPVYAWLPGQLSDGCSCTGWLCCTIQRPGHIGLDWSVADVALGSWQGHT